MPAGCAAGDRGQDAITLAELARCFDDFRNPKVIEHTAEEPIKQRVFALALGYEDLNDHDQLRADPLLSTLVGKWDVTGQERLQQRDQGKPLAGKSTNGGQVPESTSIVAWLVCTCGLGVVLRGRMKKIAA